MRSVATVSVILPTLNDAAALRNQRFLEDADEVIVADGHSSDETCAVAASRGFDVVATSPGRGRQMNVAAAQARGDVLLFLHADTRLPEAWRWLIETPLDRAAAGAFQFALSAKGHRYRLLEKLVRLRRTPYGDQAIFLRRSTFESVGGYPDWPILEDAELIRRVRKLGKVTILDAPALTCARRYQRDGILRTTLCNQRCLWAWRIGVSPQRVARWRTPFTAVQHHHAPDDHAPARRDSTTTRGSRSAEELETLGSLPQ